MSETRALSNPQLFAASLADSPALADGEQFLRLYLSTEAIALLPVQELSEVLTISTDQIVPIPHMPSWVMGVYNWRGDILWMVDLGHLCGFTPWYQQPTDVLAHNAVVLNVGANRSTRSEGQMLGIVVHRVEDIEWCDPKAIQAIQSSAMPDFNRFLRGYWWKSEEELVAVLDSPSILAAMPK